ncbi:MAG: hypothetical protein S4CHLAM20_00520 [Chlamydiia bacterium]|nr:hypothetical protein [Chlamydiia bacterium]
MIVSKYDISYNKKMQKKFSTIELLEKLKAILDNPELEKLPLYTRCHINAPLPEKETFSSLEDLTFQALDKAHLFKYNSYQIKTSKKLIFFTWVIPSGLGDLSMQIYISEMIAKKDPNLNIELISLVDERSPIPKSLKSFLPHHIIKYKHPTPPTFTDEILSLLRKAFSIIEIPTAYFDFKNFKKLVLKNNPNPPVISRIGEYGFIDTEDYNPSTKERSMGLYFLEKGVIILDKQKPQKRDPNIYFAYLITQNGIMTYFLSILMTRQNDSQDLKLIVPNLDKILPVLKQIPFSKYGIKQIRIEADPNISLLDINPTGKTITIFHQKELTPKSIVDYMSTSNAFVGIRGDGSFTEALSTDCLFFYDALDHAIPFLTDLKTIAETNLLPYYSLCEYTKVMLQTKLDPYKRALNISDYLEDPSLYIGMQKLKKIITNQYRFNETLHHLIKQNYCCYFNK